MTASSKGTLVPILQSEDERWPSSFDQSALENLVESLPGMQGLSLRDGDQEFTVLLTSDTHVQTLNKQFRDKDAPTNVLSFPDDSDGYLGDIALAFETIEQEARDQQKTLKQHMTHLIIHGLFHLLGQDHNDDASAEKMEALEIAALDGLGIPDPYRALDLAHEG